MDILGTKKIAAAFEKATGKAMVLTDEMWAKVGVELDAAGVLIAETTSLVKHADEIAKAFPAQWQLLVHDVLGLIDHMVRVGTRTSNAVQATEALVKAIHDKGFRVQIPD